MMIPWQYPGIHENVKNSSFEFEGLLSHCKNNLPILVILPICSEWESVRMSLLFPNLIQYSSGSNSYQWYFNSAIIFCLANYSDYKKPSEIYHQCLHLLQTCFNMNLFLNWSLDLGLHFEWHEKERLLLFCLTIFLRLFWCWQVFFVILKNW